MTKVWSSMRSNLTTRLECRNATSWKICWLKESLVSTTTTCLRTRARPISKSHRFHAKSWNFIDKNILWNIWRLFVEHLQSCQSSSLGCVETRERQDVTSGKWRHAHYVEGCLQTGAHNLLETYMIVSFVEINSFNCVFFTLIGDRRLCYLACSANVNLVFWTKQWDSCLWHAFMRNQVSLIFLCPQCLKVKTVKWDLFLISTRSMSPEVRQSLLCVFIFTFENECYFVFRSEEEVGFATGSSALETNSRRRISFGLR